MPKASERPGYTLAGKMTKPRKGFAMPKASRQGVTRGILTRILLVGFPETPPGGEPQGCEKQTTPKILPPIPPKKGAA